MRRTVWVSPAQVVITPAWLDFVEDDRNELRSAPGDNGSCPQPGSNLYRPGLNSGDLCLQLIIQDDSASDGGGLRNYIVKDPDGLAPAAEEAVDTSAEQATGTVAEDKALIKRRNCQSQYSF